MVDAIVMLLARMTLLQMQSNALVTLVTPIQALARLLCAQVMLRSLNQTSFH